MLFGCQRSGEEHRERPHVLLISFDTFRADAVDPFLTPALARFAEDAIAFDKAFVPYPHTLTSHMTLLTGVYPDVHSVYPPGGSLSPSISTLDSLLQAAGYRTVGVVTTEWLKPKFGFARGFDHYEILPHKATYAERVNRRALAQLPASASEGPPTFLFLHYYDPHSDSEQGGTNELPYYSPASYRRHLELAEGEFRDELGRCCTRYLIEADKARVALAQDHVDKIFELYKSGIRALDDEMGAFFDELRHRGLYDDALIVITSDHGEEFREHGRFIHSQPYDETVSVPLLIKLPGSRMAGQAVASPVESLDLLPTLLDYLGIDRPGYLEGRDLLAFASRPTASERGLIAQDSIAFHRYSLRAGRFKLLTNLKHGGLELYDLQADPSERTNLAASRPDLARQLRQELVARLEASRELGRQLETEAAATDDLLTPEEKESLEALGYLN